MKRKIKKIFDFLLDWEENKETIKWLYKTGNRYKRFIFGFLVINLISMLISLGSSIAGRYVVDAATGFRSELFFRYIAIMLATTVVSILISTTSSIFSSYVNEKFAFGMRAKMFDDVQRSDWFRLSKYHSGDILSRLSGDIDTIAASLITLFPNVIVTCCQLILVLIILFKNDPVLACISLIIGPVGMIASLLFRRKYKKYQSELRASHSEYYTFFQESLSNIGVIKTFQLEEQNMATFQDIRDRRMKLILKSSALSSIMSVAMRLVYSIGYVITFSWCAYRLTTATTIFTPSGAEVSTFTYGTMTLFLSLVSQVQGSIRSLGSIIPGLYSLAISAKRLRDITEIEKEDYSSADTIPRKVALKVNDVTFSYEDETTPVLNHISFEVPANCRVGIVGSSGAGKTTFIRMLLSLVKPNNGTLEYIDESNKTEVASPASRRFISYVPQGNTLLSGSVRSNLLSAKKDATEEEMWAALALADADSFLKKMPLGLDTVLAESAGGISEGQAQRVSIARALLRDKPVLILDEATSALDEKTEARIFEKLAQREDRTCFIITHRRSMLKYCDYILEINDDGRAVFSSFSK